MSKWTPKDQTRPLALTLSTCNSVCVSIANENITWKMWKHDDDDDDYNVDFLQKKKKKINNTNLSDGKQWK